MTFKRNISIDVRNARTAAKLRERPRVQPEGAQRVADIEAWLANQKAQRCAETPKET